MKILLHIGMPKTATTTLQCTLAENYGRLLKSDILYPKSGRFDKASNHHKLFLPAASCRNAIRTPFPQYSDSFESMVASVEDERRDAGVTSIILSTEMLWNPNAFNGSALNRIQSAFSQYEFFILAYLRPLESHAPSSYAQSVVGPQRANINFKEHVTGLFSQHIYDYEERLCTLESIFGENAVRPIWMPWIKGDALSPFRDIFPCLVNVGLADDRNIRRSWMYVSAARRLNNLDRFKLGRLNNYSRRILNRLDRYAKRAPWIEQLFNPVDANIKQTLEKRTDSLLESMQKKYFLR